MRGSSQKTHISRKRAQPMTIKLMTKKHASKAKTQRVGLPWELDYSSPDQHQRYDNTINNTKQLPPPRHLWKPPPPKLALCCGWTTSTSTGPFWPIMWPSTPAGLNPPLLGYLWPPVMQTSAAAGLHHLPSPGHQQWCPESSLLLWLDCTHLHGNATSQMFCCELFFNFMHASKY